MSAVNSFTVSGMTCGHCVASVSDAIRKLDGVTNVNVDLGSGEVSVESDVPVAADAVASAVSEAGYEVSP